MNDSISRQAAIDAIDSLYFDTVEDHDRTKERIKRLPTVQSEIIRCKDCKHYETHGHRCKVWNHGVIVMGYCYRAERSTDG